MLLHREKGADNCNRSILSHNRLVYLRRTDYHEPLMNVEEEREARKSEAVSVDKLPYDVFHGYNIIDDQAIEHARLGVRKELLDRSRRWFPGLREEDHLVDPRLNHALESREAERISDIRERQGFIATRWRAGRGFFQNARNLFRGERGLIEAETRQRYGPNQNIRARRNFVANNIWTNLNAAQQAALGAQLAALPGPPPGPFTPVGQLANCTRDQLETLQRALPFLAAPRPGPLFPSRRDIQPANDFQLLVELVETAGEQRKRALSTTIFDPTRLQHRLDALERTNPNVFNMLVMEVLERDALYPIENNPEAQALVAYVEQRLASGSPANLLRELTNIRDNLPRRTGAQAESEEATAEQQRIERANSLATSLGEMHEQLSDKYIEADSLGQALYNANSRAFHTIPPAAPAGAGAPVDTGYKAAQDRAAKLTDDARKMRDDVNKLERKFGQNARELLGSVNTANPIPAAATPGAGDPENLINFNTSAFGGFGAPPAAPAPLPNNSTHDELFGPTEYVNAGGAGAVPIDYPGRAPAAPGVAMPLSAFMNEINGINASVMNGMAQEIKAQTKESMQPRERVNPRQLLFLLKEGDMARRGITNAEMRRQHALLATNVMITDVKLEQTYRQANQELMERRAGITLGMNWLDRARKRLLASFSSSRMHRATDIIDHIAGFDKDFVMFCGMSPDITLPELRDLIDTHGGISDGKLFEYASKLKEVFMAFEMMNSEGRVEFFDGDAMDMEEIVRKLLLVREEMRSRQFFEEIRGQEGNKAELVLRKIKENGAAVKKDEEDILSRVTDRFADWKQWFSRRVLGREFGDKYAEARQYIREQGMTRGEARNYLSSQGLATAAGVLGTAYAAREWLDRGRRATRWTAAAGGRGAKGLWRRILKPVGHYGVRKPLEWTIWRPAKWTATTAGKIIAFPFVLTGSIASGMWKWAKPKSA